MATSEVEKQLKGAFEAFTTSMEAKYRPWLYETPLYIDGTRVAFLQESQRIMLKLMRYISENYAEIEHCLPHDEEVRAFLRELQEVPFQEGTFRTDFVVNEQDEVRLIEVTCRFPLNAFFRSVAANSLVNFAELERAHGLTSTRYADALLHKFLNWMGDAKRVIVILGKDQRDNESKYLAELLPKAQLEFQFRSYDEWLEHGEEWSKESAIIAELTFEEWLAMPKNLVRNLLSRPFLNDPRIVLAVHDKSFFGVVNIEEITRLALSDEETAFIRQAFAETYFFDRQPEMVALAKQTPEDWILKPRRLGRSVNIVAGSLATPEEWQEAIASAEANNDMILQRWHISKKISGEIGGNTYEDYYAGTLLYWGSEFFGPGIFRASSYPISNVKDNRMVPYFIDLHARPSEHTDLQWM